MRCPANIIKMCCKHSLMKDENSMKWLAALTCISLSPVIKKSFFG
jgi:hypothetical protein